MAFSLNDLPSVKAIKRKDGIDKQKMIARCYMVIKNQTKITEIIREALSVYLTERLKNMSNTNLSDELLQKNIIELLEYCCHDSLDNICDKDVINNEAQILQHIKWCIEYKNTKRLVFIEDEYNIYNRNVTTYNRSNTFKSVDDEAEIYEYFKLRSKYYG